MTRCASILAAFVLLLVGAAALLARPLITRLALGQQVAYFNDPATQGRNLERVADGVWTFNWNFDRTLVVQTSAGLVVVDPFNEQLARALRLALDEHGITAPVHTVIYTHFHLDHVGGAGVLQPRNVVAHADCPRYWADYPPDDRARILSPTRLVSGDVDLAVGDTKIELLYLGESHTSTMYAVRLPAQRLLYGADLVAVRALLPGGGVSLYDPGYVRALERLAALPFDTFVASHFGYGTKADFLEAVQLQRDLRALVRRSMRRQRGADPLFMSVAALEELLRDVVPPLRAKYGTWHGFDSQIAASVFAAYTAAYVGS